jgi:type VI secretion system protein ImpH
MAQLREAPYGFSFHQAVRRIEAAHPHKPRVGTSFRAADDPVRFGQDPSLAFPPAEISSVVTRPDGLSRLAVNFVGFLGPNGPLPIHITAYARERQLARDNTLVRFLDLLGNRMIALFHRAWAVNQKTVSYDRPDSDRWMAYFASLAGLGQASLRGRDRVPDAAKLFYVGRLAPQVKSAAGLRDVLADFLAIPVEIREFIGQWIPLPTDCQCRLGESPATGQLGRTLIVGERVWDCSMKFRVRLGPLSLRDFDRFLPGQASLQRLHDWVDLYAGQELEWDVQLCLRRDEVPQLRLGQAGRLGWTTWLGTRTQPGDAEDVILSSTAAA